MTSEPLSNERLTEISDRLDASTPGNWGVGNTTNIALDVKQISPGHCRWTVKLAEVSDDNEREDYAAETGIDVAHAGDDGLFIAHARRDVEDLLHEIERLRAELKVAFGPRLYFQVQEVLDKALGTGEDDGAGAGIVAEVTLVVERMQAAESEIGRLKAVAHNQAAMLSEITSTCMAAERERDRLKVELAEQASAMGDLLDELDGREGAGL